MTTESERAARERLAVCLARLAAFRATDLAQAGPGSVFRPGFPYFERTLSLFRQLAHSSLRDLSSEDLHAAAEQAEKTLAQFREIMTFTGKGVVNSRKAGLAMIAGVRDGYPALREKLSPFIAAKAPATRQEAASKAKWNVTLAIGFAAAAGAAALVIANHYSSYLYPQYTVLAEKVMSVLR
jgi:hypothetical protein